MNDIKNITSEQALAKAAKQMEEPEEGDQIAIFHIKGYGDITVKFFEEVAPKAVENFVTHAKEGYYDGVIFHRVIEEFMIQGGDPEGTGYGGESIWGEGFEEELSVDALPYRGALCMASGGTGTKSLGSQFYIVQANHRSQMESYMKSYGLENFIEAYKKYGGDLADLVGYGQYTTFGQVIDGMDVVDKIAKVETNSKDKPLSDVVIESIEITTYSK
ncbi:MAG: peptidylprolyl isomerase [Clostridia bacterium]|nr:peptidylprolyl isomerase [Clostridia bacterium]